MTDNASLPPSTDRWYSFLGFQFSCRQAKRAALLLTVGVLAGWVAFRVWYNLPRAVSRLIRSEGGWVLSYRRDRTPNDAVARFFRGQARLIGLKPTDVEVNGVQLTESKVTDAWLHHLKPLERMRFLHIHERQLGLGLADLAELPELSHIAVWHLRTGDLSHLCQLPNLTGVSLVRADCSKVDLSQLAALPKLDFLEFPSTKLTEQQFEQISKITALHHLQLGDAVESADYKGLAHLAKSSKLQMLSIHKATDTMADEIEKIDSLTYLTIENCMLTDKGAVSLAKLRNLKDLNLLGCENPLDVTALQKLMPGCRINYQYRPIRER